MSRANSLKKAVRQIVEHAEKTLDEQNALTTMQNTPEIHLEDEVLQSPKQATPLQSPVSEHTVSPGPIMDRLQVILNKIS